MDDLKGGPSGSKFLWRDPESRTEVMTEKQSQRLRSKENSGRSKWL